MKNCLLLLSFFVSIGLFAQKNTAFYQIDSIQEIRIVFSQSNWDYLMDTAKLGTEETYLIAKSVTINGVLFDSVGVKYKGNSTFNQNNKKNPLHIELNTIKGKQDYLGVTDIKLSNVWADPSFVREALSYYLLANYMHCPRANFAKVYINDVYYGLMTNQENIGKDFYDDHFSTSDGVAFKCNPISIGGGGGGGVGGGRPDLTFKGKDSSLYKNSYELRSDIGWGDLVKFIDTLNNLPSKIEGILDVDRAIWMLAFNNLFVNLDSYSGAFAQNYYLYKDKNNRFNPIVWDLNMSFAAFTMTGGSPSNVDTSTAKTMTPSLHFNNTGRPLISKLMANPTYKRMYFAHMKTMLQESFVSGLYLQVGEQMQNIIKTSVETDNNKFYTNQSFYDNLTKSVKGSSGPGGGTSLGIKSLMENRAKYLNTLTEFKAIPPTIGERNSIPSLPKTGEQMTITAKITGTITNVYLGYRGDKNDKFIKVTMLDDGLHQDGAANDGVFGANITPDAKKVQYYIYAENNDAGIFSPQRAEHEYHIIILESNPPLKGEVVINEFLADNLNGTTNNDGKNEDWIELYNNSTRDINLADCYLTDDNSIKSKWKFPSQSVIPAKGFLIVWADEKSDATEIHCNFKLSKSGESLYFYSTDSTQLLDNVSFGEQETDLSYGRYPNGTGAFTKMPMTFNSLNSLTVANQDITNEYLLFYPNPTNEFLNIESNKEIHSIKLFDILGKRISTISNLQTSNYQLDVNNMTNGIYYIQVNQMPMERFIILH